MTVAVAIVLAGCSGLDSSVDEIQNKKRLDVVPNELSEFMSTY